MTAALSRLPGTEGPSRAARHSVGRRLEKRQQPRAVIAAVIARGLVCGITVVSGLAVGIDAAAHLAMLNAAGRTVAIMGTGINHCYRAAHRALQHRISIDGLVLSQFWPDAPPTKRSYPMRNAVMSGYGLPTVVVEAGERSGARIQARLAVEHGRPVNLLEDVVKSTSWGRRLAGLGSWWPGTPPAFLMLSMNWTAPRRRSNSYWRRSPDRSREPHRSI